MYAFSMKMVVFSDCFIVYTSPKCIKMCAFSNDSCISADGASEFFPGYIKRRMDPVSYR